MLNVCSNAGYKPTSFNASETSKDAWYKRCFIQKLYEDGFEQGGFDTRSFNDFVVVVGNTTWEVMQARKKLKVQWEPAGDTKDTMGGKGGYCTGRVGKHRRPT